MFLSNAVVSGTEAPAVTAAAITPSIDIGLPAGSCQNVQWQVSTLESDPTLQVPVGRLATDEQVSKTPCWPHMSDMALT